MKERTILITYSGSRLRLEERLRGIFRDLGELKKTTRFMDKEGQTKKTWERSQIVLFGWKGQKGEIVRPSIWKWAGSKKNAHTQPVELDNRWSRKA